MDQKAWLYALAASGLVAGAIQRADEAAATPQKEKKTVECFGLNDAKGANSCGVGDAQIAVAKHIFGKKYEASKPSDCAGTSEGADKDGYLAWIKKDNKKDCFNAGGFIYVKDKKGEFQIENKDGIQTKPVENKKDQ